MIAFRHEVARPAGTVFVAVLAHMSLSTIQVVLWHTYQAVFG